MIDTHCHLNFPPLSSQLDAVLARAKEAGVEKILVPGVNRETSISAVNLAEEYPQVYAQIGIHPSDAHEYTEEDRKWMLELLGETNSLVAIGEVGLDYYHLEDYLTPAEQAKRKQIQIEVFREFIGLAKDCQLPLVIHTREAFDDTYRILQEVAAGHPMVIHCFTGSLQQAQQWLDLGCLLSITGILTYPKNEELRSVVAEIPLEKILLETDAPYLPPQGFRGQVCEPMHVRQVAEMISEIKEFSLEEVDQITTETATRFFGLK